MCPPRRQQMLMGMLYDVSQSCSSNPVKTAPTYLYFQASDSPGVYKVLTSKTHALTLPLPTGSIYRINTGGPLPAGTDAVIMVEDTKLISTYKDADGEDGEEDEVETLARVPAGENVRAPGSDVKKGDLALRRGEVITSVGGEIGTLAFVGRKEASSYRIPYSLH